MHANYTIYSYESSLCISIVVCVCVRHNSSGWIVFRYASLKHCLSTPYPNACAERNLSGFCESFLIVDDPSINHSLPFPSLPFLPFLLSLFPLLISLNSHDCFSMRCYFNLLLSFLFVIHHFRSLFLLSLLCFFFVVAVITASRLSCCCNATLRAINQVSQSVSI